MALSRQLFSVISYQAYLALSLPEDNHTEDDTAQDAGTQDNGHQEAQTGVHV